MYLDSGHPSALILFKPIQQHCNIATNVPGESYVYEEDSSFSKTVKVKQQSATLTTHETHPVIEDVSDGVYKTETELYEAATIDEDENTKVDLPIDQVSACRANLTRMSAVLCHQIMI